jgi:hypothetical protein
MDGRDRRVVMSDEHIERPLRRLDSEEPAMSDLSDAAYGFPVPEGFRADLLAPQEEPETEPVAGEPTAETEFWITPRRNVCDPDEIELLGIMAEAMEAMPEAGRVPALRYLMDRFGQPGLMR